MTHSSIYFYGNKVSEEGIRRGYVDYRTLANSFNHVSCFDESELFQAGEFEPYTNNERYYEVDGKILTPDEADEKRDELESRLDFLDEEKDADEIAAIEEELEELENEKYYDVFSWFIVDENGVDILEEAGEIVYYSNRFNMYLWGVTHCGTAWDYVMTNIKLDIDNE